MTVASSEQSPPQPKMTSVRRGFLKQVVLLAGPYWKCERCWKVRGAVALLLALTIAQVALSVWSNYWRGDLFDALEQHSISGLLIQIGIFVLIFLLSIVVTGGHLLIKRWLQMDWRAWLTDQLEKQWMEGGRFYRLLHTPGDHDNPDQRIAEDIRIATEIAVALGHTLIYSLLSVGLFIDILWSLSGSVDIPGTRIHIPGYMVMLAFLYAALGSVFGWMMGRPLVSSTNALQNAEATYRFGLSRIRENPEAIALMRGESLEKAKSSNRFLQVIREWNRQSLAYMGLVAFGTGYGLLLPIFPILVAAPQYIRGVMTLGLLMQAAEAFQRLTSALSWPVDNIGEMARCRASAERVLSLYQAIQDVQNCKRDDGRVCIQVERSQRSRLVIQNLCIAEPTGRVLLEQFHADFRRGERVLLTGDPEITSALFKVLAGLWLWGGGKVMTPPLEDMMFIPQRPFLYEGTLGEVLCYPHPVDRFSPAVVRHALECSGLAWIASRLNESDNWEEVLPQRSQQRICFARALIHKPSWICMQEVLDAFSPKGARIVFEMLRRELPNTTLLNISFQAGLRTLHHRVVTLGRARSPKTLEPGDAEESGGF